MDHKTMNVEDSTLLPAAKQAYVAWLLTDDVYDFIPASNGDVTLQARNQMLRLTNIFWGTTVIGYDCASFVSCSDTNSSWMQEDTCRFKGQSAGSDLLGAIAEWEKTL
jgi:hypothetical protein